VALWFTATSAGLVTVVMLRRPVVESRARRGDVVDGLSREASGDRSRCSAQHPGMFVETIVLPRPEWERWEERLRYSTDPPKALIATIVWDSGDGQVTGVNVWDTPGAIADFYMDRVRPIVEAEGEPTNRPERHGEPLAFYLRH
jgi:hypothetical protein